MDCIADIGVVSTQIGEGVQSHIPIWTHNSFDILSCDVKADNEEDESGWKTVVKKKKVKNFGLRDAFQSHDCTGSACRAGTNREASMKTERVCEKSTSYRQDLLSTSSVVSNCCGTIAFDRKGVSSTSRAASRSVICREPCR